MVNIAIFYAKNVGLCVTIIYGRGGMFMEEVVYFDNLYQLNRKTTKENYDNMKKQMSEFTSYIKSKNLPPIEEIIKTQDNYLEKKHRKN